MAGLGGALQGLAKVKVLAKVFSMAGFGWAWLKVLAKVLTCFSMAWLGQAKGLS